MGPDPDGPGGGLKNRTVQIEYNGDGSVRNRRVGTSNPDTSNWNELQRVEVRYDADARPIRQRLSAGGTVYGLSETSYDAAGRVDCSTVRMNPGAFAAQWDGSTGTCDLGPQGVYGPDRIGRAEYDETNAVTKIWSGYRTADAAQSVRYQYTNDGQVEHVQDANGNPTTYSYDGFDRLRYTCFNAWSCNGGDYEALAYGTSGNATGQVTNRRFRDGNSMGFGYDALGRLTYRGTSGAAWQDQPRSYGYDLLGRLTAATDTTYAHSTSYGYDALGRVVFEQNPWQHKNYGYDAAGRLTYLGYGDGYSVNYSYYNSGEMAGVYENGLGASGAALAYYYYDDLGRRTGMWRPNNTNVNWYYAGTSPWLINLVRRQPWSARGRRHQIG